MLSIAVCDDELIECCNIARQINKILEELNVACTVRQFSSGQELLNAAEQFDIIFLDIIMCRIDGMRTAQLLREKAFDKLLVFISSSGEYILDAYDVEAFSYLLKPVDENKLKKVLQRAIPKIEYHSQEYMIVSKERQKRKLFLDDVYYFEIKGRMMEVYGTKDVFTFYERISHLEDTLRNKGFFRCHKGYLINMKYVTVYNRQELTLDNGQKLPIAKRRYEEFCREILEYMRKNGGIV